MEKVNEPTESSESHETVQSKLEKLRGYLKDLKIGSPVDFSSDIVRLNKAHIAAYECDLAQLRKLVNEHNVNEADSRGRPIIFATIDRAHQDPKAPAKEISEVFDFLFEQGAYLDTVTKKHPTSAFEYATWCSIKNKKIDFTVLDDFIDRDASPFHAPPLKKTAFEIACSCTIAKDKESLYPQADEMIKFFQSKAKTLHYAIVSFNVSKVKELANEKNVNEFESGEKPLYTAITYYNQLNSKPMLEIIKILLQKKVEINEKIETEATFNKKIDAFRCKTTKKTFFNTYLMVATIRSIFQGNTQMIPLLLEAGADPKKSFGEKLPCAFSLAQKAANLTLAEIQDQAGLGFTKEIFEIQHNKETASAIVALFEKHCTKK